jgi:hypothetical protein
MGFGLPNNLPFILISFDRFTSNLSRAKPLLSLFDHPLCLALSWEQLEKQKEFLGAINGSFIVEGLQSDIPLKDNDIKDQDT